jgi:hypothetical protein
LSRLAIAYVVFAIAAIGFLSFVDAESVTIEVPHEYDYNECMTFEDEFGTPFTQCVWNGVPANPYHLSTENDNGCIDGYDRDYLTGECKSVERIIEEAKILYEQRQLEAEDRLSPTDRVIKQLEEEQERHPLDAADKQLLDKLKKLGAVCKYDIAQIQTYEEFDIPTDIIVDPTTGETRIQIYKNWDLKSIDLSKHYLLSKIDRAVEACIGQNVLSTKIIGAGTTNKIVDVWDGSRYHAEHTYLDNEFANGKHYPIAPQVKVNNIENIGKVRDSIRDVICSSQHFTDAFKKQNACPKPHYVNTIPQPNFNPFGDEGRQLLEDKANYDNGDMKDQEYKVITDAINKKLENLK